MLLWDVSTRTQAGTLEGLADDVTSLSFSQDGGTLATASGDSSVLLWDVASPSEADTLKGDTGSITLVAFSPDADTLVTASEDGNVLLWNVGRRWVVDTLEGHTGSVTSVIVFEGRRHAGHRVKGWYGKDLGRGDRVFRRICRS